MNECCRKAKAISAALELLTLQVELFQEWLKERGPGDFAEHMRDNPDRTQGIFDGADSACRQIIKMIEDTDKLLGEPNNAATGEGQSVREDVEKKG